MTALTPSSTRRTVLHSVVDAATVSFSSSCRSEVVYDLWLQVDNITSALRGMPYINLGVVCNAFIAYGCACYLFLCVVFFFPPRGRGNFLF